MTRTALPHHTTATKTSTDYKTEGRDATRDGHDAPPDETEENDTTGLASTPRPTARRTSENETG